ncbi:MAG: hypothetical protein ACI9TP_002124, partial [Candidatus Azotimanducaceae bacterium]
MMTATPLASTPRKPPSQKSQAPSYKSNFASSCP